MILVDTTILIGIERGDLSIKAFFDQHPSEEYAISSISIQELYVGLGYSKIKKGVGFYEKQKRILDAIIHDFVIITLSEEILKLSGLKQGELLAQGITEDSEDILIGITAECMKTTKILTKNTKHFVHFNIPCESL